MLSRRQSSRRGRSLQTGKLRGQQTASYFDGGFAAAAARDKMYA